MFKKMGLLLIFGVLFSSMSVYAQSGNEQIVPVKVEPIGQVQAFNGLEARHCDQGLESELLTTTSSLTLDSSEVKSLCNVFLNQSDSAITVQYGYVDSSFGDDGKPMCDANMGAGKLASIITMPEDNTFTIPAHSNVVRHDKMFLPPGMSGGIIHGCLGYGLVSLEPKPGERVPMFKITYRKVILYDVLAGGQSAIKNSISLESQSSDLYITNRKIKVSSDVNGVITISAIVKNGGNIDQLVSLSGRISNFLGFDQKFALEERKIGPYQTIELSAPIGILPSYKGIFDIEVSIPHKPALAFDASNLSEDLLKGDVFYETGALFVFSWYVAGLLVFLLLLLRLLIRSILPRRKQD